MFGYIKEKTTNHVIGYWDLNEKPADTDEFEFVECLESEKPELYQEDIVEYNASDLMSWCIDYPLQEEDFTSLDSGVQIQAISFTQTFALNCNNKGAALYRKSALLCDSLAGNTVCSEMAETIIAKAIELGANIEEV